MSYVNPETAAYLKPTRKIGAFEGYVTVSEDATDELEITAHPVQSGADITDHAYKKSASLTVECVFGATDAKRPDEMYAELLAYQAKREPFNVVTGKRLYKNMLIKSLTQTTSAETENVLSIRIGLQEVRITGVAWTKIPAVKKSTSKQTTKTTGQKSPEKTSAATEKKAATLQKLGEAAKKFIS